MITYLVKVTPIGEITEKEAHIAMDENINPKLLLGCHLWVRLVESGLNKTARLNEIIREENIDE